MAKKSEMYKLAQLAVIRDDLITAATKIEIIRELQERESLALFAEGREAAENGTN